MPNDPKKSFSDFSHNLHIEKDLWYSKKFFKRIRIFIDFAVYYIIGNGNYGASWEEAADIFKNAVTKEQWEGMAKAVRQPLGKLISRQVISKTPTQTIPGGPDGKYVIIQFKTAFENKADAIESVTPMLDKDGVWRVSGYYIK